MESVDYVIDEDSLKRDGIDTFVLETPSRRHGSSPGTCTDSNHQRMSKDRSVCKEWDFVSKGTEISMGRFLIEQRFRTTREVV